MKRTNAKGGFTLIELLVVIAIIGILSSIVLVSLNTARSKGKDSHIIADVSGMRTGLESASNGANYNGFFVLTATAGAPTLTDTNMTTTYGDAVSYGPTGYVTNPLGTAVWTGTAVAYNAAYPITIATDVTPPLLSAGWGATGATKYAIRGRLSTGVYFCLDSTGKADSAEAPLASGSFGTTCL